MILIIKIIIGIAIVVLLNFRELINSESRVKAMIVYFFLIAVALALSVLLNFNRQPPNPIIALMDAFKSLGLEKNH